MLKDIITIGGLTVHGYGLMIAIGFMLAVFVAMHRAKGYGLNQESIIDIALIAIICGFLGAKLLYIIVEFKDFEDYVQLANLLHLESGISNLFEYNDKYYLQLILFTDEMHEMTYSDVLALLSEYSFKTKVTAAVLSEYGQEIMSKTALELTRYYFGN